MNGQARLAPQQAEQAAAAAITVASTQRALRAAAVMLVGLIGMPAPTQNRVVNHRRQCRPAASATGTTNTAPIPTAARHPKTRPRGSQPLAKDAASPKPLPLPYPKGVLNDNRAIAGRTTGKR